MKKIYLAAAFVISASTLNAQWIEFPVVFHVVYANAQQNIPDSVLQHQLDVLNEDFQAMNPDIVNVPLAWQPIIGNMNIGFEFASTDPQGNPTIGIERRQVTQGQISSTTAHSFALGGLDPWPDTSYLNIWVYNFDNGLLGWGTFPDSNPATLQYVDLDYNVVGRNDPNGAAPYNKGRTATHSMGHFFGLYHIWGDDGMACSGSDGIADTPNQAQENYAAHAPGTIITDGCTSGGQGIMWQNYMDYTEDAGMCLFTQDQVVLVTNNINTYFPMFVIANNIEPLQNHEAFKYSVFPSPSTSGIFQVNRVDYDTKTSVEVYDLQGRMILAPAYFENGSTTMQIDLSGFTNGTYSFVIRTDSTAETKRVVIAK